VDLNHVLNTINPLGRLFDDRPDKWLTLLPRPEDGSGVRPHLGGDGPLLVKD
jgi:hypothetical protein